MNRIQPSPNKPKQTTTSCVHGVVLLLLLLPLSLSRSSRGSNHSSPTRHPHDDDAGIQKRVIVHFNQPISPRSHGFRIHQTAPRNVTTPTFVCLLLVFNDQGPSKKSSSHVIDQVMLKQTPAPPPLHLHNVRAAEKPHLNPRIPYHAHLYPYDAAAAATPPLFSFYMKSRSSSRASS
jgi:hypothetical protein